VKQVCTNCSRNRHERSMRSYAVFIIAFLGSDLAGGRPGPRRIKVEPN